MHRFVFIATLLALLLLPSRAVLAQYDERLPIPVARALKSAAIPSTAVAVWVQDVSSPLPRVSLNAAQALNPASTLKLLTTYAALDSLGPAYTWKTEAWTSGTLVNEGLDGDLYLRGGGDPKLTVEQFWLLLRNLRARGLRDIRGDLVLDRGLFEVADSTLIDDQALRPYNVTPDALLLNFKALRLQLLPDAEKKRVTVIAEPRLDKLEVDNRIRLGSNACGDWKENLRA